MDKTTRFAAKFPRASLRVRVALGVAFPVFISLLALSLLHYTRERNLLEDQIQLTAVQVGEVALGSLRHVMLENDQTHMEQILLDVGRLENVQRILLVNALSRITADSNGEALGESRSTTSVGCRECHEIPPSIRPRAINLQTLSDTLRISTPINNDAACQQCHLDEEGHLGVLLIDMSLANAHTQLLRDLRVDLSITIGFTILVTIGVYLLTHLLVVRRIERFRGPMEALASGDFGARLYAPNPPVDELDALATTANHMASELERYIAAQEERHLLRHRAIVEERERIAREIHDGIAQLMGYVNNKAGAARLLLSQGREKDAHALLEQLDTASQQAFTELRAAILNLRTSDSPSAGLIHTLRAYATSFSELTDIQVDVSLPEENNWKLPPETELHLLRIAQEALSNVQKHAGTVHAWIYLKVVDAALELTIGDGGAGFELHVPFEDGRPHFGLNNMRERAESIGASFELDSEPDGGTRVSIRLPLEGL